MDPSAFPKRRSGRTSEVTRFELTTAKLVLILKQRTSPSMRPSGKKHHLARLFRHGSKKIGNKYTLLVPFTFYPTLALLKFQSFDLRVCSESMYICFEFPRKLDLSPRSCYLMNCVIRCKQFVSTFLKEILKTYFQKFQSFLADTSANATATESSFSFTG